MLPIKGFCGFLEPEVAQINQVWWRVRIVKWLRASSRSGRWKVGKRTIVKWLRAFSRSGWWKVGKRTIVKWLRAFSCYKAEWLILDTGCWLRIVKWLRAFSCSSRWKVGKRSIVKWLRAFSWSGRWKVGKWTIVKWLRALVNDNRVSSEVISWVWVGYLFGKNLVDFRWPGW